MVTIRIRQTTQKPTKTGTLGRLTYALSHPRAVNPPRESPRHYLLLAGVLTFLAVGTIIDLIFDDLETIWSLHVLFELLLMCIGLGTALYLWLAWRRARLSLDTATARIVEHRAERDLWRGRARKFVQGLGAEIDRQLRDWSLTPAERATAMFLLKGLSHKDIASLTGKSERTVRNQSTAVYRKSGLSGRAELSAFFLEDLLPPDPQEADGPEDAAGSLTDPVSAEP